MIAKIRTFRYVHHADVSAYLELGWTTPEPNCPHPQMDRYGVTMEWVHDRPLVEPMGQFEAGAFLRDQRWDRGEIAPFRSMADLVNRIADKMVAEMEAASKQAVLDSALFGKGVVKVTEKGAAYVPPDEWEDYERAAEDEQRRRDARDGFDE